MQEIKVEKQESGIDSAADGGPSTPRLSRPSRRPPGPPARGTSSRPRPSTTTVHAPHSPSPQPSFVPVRPQSSRSTSSRRVIGCTRSDTRVPFSTKTMGPRAAGHRRAPFPLASRLSPSASVRGAAMTRSGVAGTSLDIAWPRLRHRLHDGRGHAVKWHLAHALAPYGHGVHGCSTDTMSIVGVSIVVGTM